MRRFSAPWDRALLLSTVFLLAVMLCASIAGISTAARDHLRGVAAAVAALAAGTATVAWALAPSAFEIGGGVVRILRNGWFGTAIPLEEVCSAGQIGPDALVGTIRLLGIGGLFGSYGLFRSPVLGPLRLYATRSDGLVLVRTARRAHVLTPDRPSEFVDALLQAAPAARRELRRAR